eukprot:360666-Chlamydomonas_euryale.AAC.4
MACHTACERARPMHGVWHTGTTITVALSQCKSRNSSRWSQCGLSHRLSLERPPGFACWRLSKAAMQGLCPHRGALVWH